MIQYHSDYNPFKLILDYFPEKAKGPLTIEELYSVKTFLQLGGIYCESEEEIIKCLFLMKDLGLIDIKTLRNKKEETFYEVTKIYGKQ